MLARSLMIKLGAVAATGSAALALFGGAAVHTDFTSAATRTVSAGAASVGLSIGGGSDYNGNISCSNLVPGATSAKPWDGGGYCTTSVTVKNTGSVKEDFTLSVGDPNPSLSASDAGLVTVNFTSPFSYSATLAGLEGKTIPVSYPIAAGDTATFTLEIDLGSTAGNNWSGFSFSVPYTVQAEIGY